MAKITTLKDGSESVYPRTIVEAITDNDGTSLEDKLDVRILEAPQDGKKYVRCDAGWVEADAKIDLFIDMWNSAVRSYGTYNAETGYFELNGLEFDYETALYHYNFANECMGRKSGTFYGNDNIKTNIPPHSTASIVSLSMICYSCNYMTIFVWGGGYIPTITNVLQNCSRLVTIYASSYGVYIGGKHAGLTSLETFNFKGMTTATSFADSPNFSYGSIYYIINNSAATSTITFTLHETAAENARASYLEAPEEGYETFDLWAASKNISIATA